MADKKISALTAATTPLAGTEVLPIVQSSATVKVSVANLTAGRDTTVANAVIYDPGYGYFGVRNSSLAADFANNALAQSSDGLNTVVNAKTGGTVKLRINDTSVVEVATDTTIKTGNIVQGTAGKGVNFTANTGAAGKTSQLLNWYEEGTWTPVLDSAVAGSGRATTVNSAKYTRIGNMVTVQCYIKMGTLGTGGSGAWSVKGLPFTSAGSSAYGVAHVGYAATLNATVANLGGYISPSTTVITVSGSTGASTLPYGDLDFATYVKANTEMVISATYYV